MVHPLDGANRHHVASKEQLIISNKKGCTVLYQQRSTCDCN